MSHETYTDVLTRARRLSPGEQQSLIAELVTTPNANGAAVPGKTLLDGLRECGLIGALVDAPSDLATNPKHMEGFGEGGDCQVSRSRSRLCGRGARSSREARRHFGGVDT